MATKGSLGLLDAERVAGMETLATARRLTDWEALFVGEMRKKIAAGEDLNLRQKAVLQRFYGEHAVKGELP